MEKINKNEVFEKEIKKELKKCESIYEVLENFYSEEKYEIVDYIAINYFDELYKINLKNFAFLEIATLVKLNKKKEIDEFIKKLRSYPYISQVYEEVLNDLDNLKESAINFANDKTDLLSRKIEMVKNELNSSDFFDVISGFYDFETLDREEHIDLSSYVYEILKAKTEFYDGYYLLFSLLTLKQYKGSLSFIKDNFEYDIKIEDFADKNNQFLINLALRIKYAKSYLKNISVLTQLDTICYILMSAFFPEDFDDLDIDNFLILALSMISHSYNYNLKEDPVYEKLDVDEEKIEKYMQRIDYYFKKRQEKDIQKV